MGLCILIIPVAQILLKLGSKKKDRVLSRLLRPYLLLGFILLFFVSILSVYSFQEVPLKTSAAWSSLSYVLVAISSKFLLKEPFPMTRWLGCFYFVGIFVFHL